ncbi:MAG: type II secretion system F family protein [Desulfomonilia bacterium]
MLFTYQALNQDGSVIAGQGHFDDIGGLMDTLSSQDQILLKYRKRRFILTDAIDSMIQPRVERPDIIEFCEALSSMVASGLPLLESMESIKDTVRNKRLKKALERVIREITGGESLSGAFRAQPEVFPPMLSFFCNIGEETGTIQEALKSTAEYIKRVDDIISQTKRALIYPAFVISAMGGVMVFWLFFVLPRLVDTFNDMNVVLPDMTLALVEFVEFSRACWYVFPAAILFLIAFFCVLKKHERTRVFLSMACFRIPVAGKLLKNASLTLFFSNMSLMLRSGVTLTKCFDVLETTFSNPAVTVMIARIRQAAGRGESLLNAFALTRFFDSVTLRMVSVGESTGTLDQRLQYLADMYQEQTSRSVDVMGKMIEPIVMALSGGLFVFIVISLIGPVYDLISQLGGG